MNEIIKENGWSYYVENGAAIVTGIPAATDKELIIPEALGGYPVEEMSFYFSPAEEYSSIRLSKNIKRFDAACVARTIKSVFTDSDNEYFISKNGSLYSKDGKTLVSYHSAEKEFDASCLDGVEIIGDGAFTCCDCIEDLIIPDSIISIGDNAFCYCNNLKSVYIPDSIVHIGKAVFAHSSVKSVRLSKNIKSLEADFSFDGEGEGFFADSKLESIVITDGIEKIGYLTFGECRSLKEIYIPESVSEIEDYAFHQCEALEKITVSEKNEHYYSVDGVLYSRDGILLCYPASKKSESFTVPDEVRKIEKYAFFKCRGLKKLTLPESVSEIGIRALALSTIEEVNIPESIKSIEYDVFLYTAIKELYIHEAVEFIEMNSGTAGNINPFKDMTLIVHKGSYAERMCIKHKLRYTAIE